jgi:hypothetical protein
MNTSPDHTVLLCLLGLTHFNSLTNFDINGIVFTTHWNLSVFQQSFSVRSFILVLCIFIAMIAGNGPMPDLRYFVFRSSEDLRFFREIVSEMDYSSLPSSR